MSDIIEEAKSLAPWHFKELLIDGIYTTDLNDPNSTVSKVTTKIVENALNDAYPNGLESKTVLDVGCNGGSNGFLCLKMGAKHVVGVDARAHWIKQAEFLRRVKNINNIEFHHQEIDTFLNLSNQKFDIIIFKGVFYHLRNPVKTLENLCNSCNETILINTATADNVPKNCIRIERETKADDKHMSGVHGLCWLPGSPEVVDLLLNNFGFEGKVVRYQPSRESRLGRGRLTMIGKKKK